MGPLTGMLRPPMVEMIPKTIKSQYSDPVANYFGFRKSSLTKSSLGQVSADAKVGTLRERD